MAKNKQKIKIAGKAGRAARTRRKIKGRATLPRLSVFRSLKHIYAQIIDDEAGKTLASVSDLKIKNAGTKNDVAKEMGKKLAAASLEKNIKEVVFDRGSFRYHGRVKSLAEGAREGGLKF